VVLSILRPAPAKRQGVVSVRIVDDWAACGRRRSIFFQDFFSPEVAGCIDLFRRAERFAHDGRRYGARGDEVDQREGGRSVARQKTRRNMPTRPQIIGQAVQVAIRQHGLKN